MILLLTGPVAAILGGINGYILWSQTAFHLGFWAIKMLPTLDCQAGGWWPPGCGLLSQTQYAATNTITQMFAGVMESMASWMWSFIAAVSLMQQLTEFTESASTAVLATLGSDPYVGFMRLFGFGRAPAGSAQQWNLISLSTPGTNDGPVGSVITTVVAVAIVWILSFVLMCSMIFRSFALPVLAPTAPVAIMLMPWERTKSWTRRWCETVVALLIAKSLTATVLAVAVKLFANSTSFAGLASGAVGMLLALCSAVDGAASGRLCRR